MALVLVPRDTQVYDPAKAIEREVCVTVLNQARM